MGRLSVGTVGHKEQKVKSSWFKLLGGQGPTWRLLVKPDARLSPDLRSASCVSLTCSSRCGLHFRCVPLTGSCVTQTGCPNEMAACLLRSKASSRSDKCSHQPSTGVELVHGDSWVCVQLLRAKRWLLFVLQDNLQIRLKSIQGPIEVYLCPEEVQEPDSPVKELLLSSSSLSPSRSPNSTQPSSTTSPGIAEPAAPSGKDLRAEGQQVRAAVSSLMSTLLGCLHLLSCWEFGLAPPTCTSGHREAWCIQPWSYWRAVLQAKGACI